MGISDLKDGQNSGHPNTHHVWATASPSGVPWPRPSQTLPDPAPLLASLRIRPSTFRSGPSQFGPQLWFVRGLPAQPDSPLSFGRSWRVLRGRDGKVQFLHGASSRHVPERWRRSEQRGQEAFHRARCCASPSWTWTGRLTSEGGRGEQRWKPHLRTGSLLSTGKRGTGWKEGRPSFCPQAQPPRGPSAGV